MQRKLSWVRWLTISGWRYFTFLASMAPAIPKIKKVGFLVEFGDNDDEGPRDGHPLYGEAVDPEYSIDIPEHTQTEKVKMP